MYEYRIEPCELEFVKPARTSRNTFKKKQIWLIHLREHNGSITGTGEAAPLSKLSIDDIPSYPDLLEKMLEIFSETGDLEALDLQKFPSIQFGLETAILDLQNGGNKILFDTAFTRSEKKIPINGLVWMDDIESMKTEAVDKINAGFNCIKFKVGALDFDDECKLLEYIRKMYPAFKLELRLDANGAFHPLEVREQLRELKRYEIHSIEQPIMKGNWDRMASLCSEKTIAIALDEELIGIDPFTEGEMLLKEIKPQYIILKPSLLGGFSRADQWVHLAQKNGSKWWATSALEGNTGLNAIAQWVSQYDISLHQGLGTGNLYKNNVAIDLKIEQGFMQRIKTAKSP